MKTRGLHAEWLMCTVLVTIAGCKETPRQALGTLEYDRITLPAPAAERIVSIAVNEGDHVSAGQVVLRLEATRTQSATIAVQAEAQRQREVLAEVETGPRPEVIAQAQAQLAGAQAQASEARAYYARLSPLGRRQLVAAVDVDRARAASVNADAQVRVARAALEELQHGSRRERIAQGASGVRAAEAQAAVQQITQDKLQVVAPRAGRIDSLPYKVGDQAPIGAALAVLLVGDAPYARIYVPEQARVGIKVGSRVQVFVADSEQAYSGRVRMIRSEPSFTPYYALFGDDAARLSYLAEVQLDGAAASLPAGLPVRAQFSDPRDSE